MANPMAAKNDVAKLLPVEAKLTPVAAVALGALLDVFVLDGEEVPVPDEEPELPEPPGFVEGGDAAGVTTTEAKRPVPFAFDAVTLTEYVVPFWRSDKVQEDPPAPVVEHVGCTAANWAPAPW